MGAEVIKVETPEGDPIRGLGPARHPGMGAYSSTSTATENLVLDLKQPAGTAAFVRLTARRRVPAQYATGRGDTARHRLRGDPPGEPAYRLRLASGYRANGPGAIGPPSMM